MKDLVFNTRLIKSIYFNRLIFKFFISFIIDYVKLNAWAISVNFKLRLLIFIEVDRFKVLALFYYYYHLNNINLTNLLYINLIIYRIRIIFDIKLVFNMIQKR